MARAFHIRPRRKDAMSIHNDYSIRPLAAAVVIQAAKEAHTGDPDARAWLKGEGLLWMEICGVSLEQEQVTQWIARGCRLPQTKLHFGNS